MAGWKACPTPYCGIGVFFAGGRGGGTPTGMGVLHNRHGTARPRSCCSTSMNLRHFGFGHCTAKTFMSRPLLDLQPAQPLGLARHLLLTQAAAAVDGRARHLAA